MSGPVSAYLRHHFRHFNAAALIDAADGYRAHLDGNGKMASAVSTSGMAWKYPGRVGDSPIIGAGNYCDGRYGAAACTGLGELAIRASTARSLVLYLKMSWTSRSRGWTPWRSM